MSNLKITELGAELLIIQQAEHKPKLCVIIKVTEQVAGSEEVVVVSTKTEYRKQPVTYSGDLFVFTRQQYKKMLENFALGNCPVTTKGLRRYSTAWGSGTEWWNQPARAA